MSLKRAEPPFPPFLSVRTRRVAAIVACAAVFFSATAGAQPSGSSGASIVIFPKVIAAAGRDTLVQIVNIDPAAPIHARCFYVDGALSDPNQPAGPSNTPSCAFSAFELTLDAAQPTHFVASRGRTVDPSSPNCTKLSGAQELLNDDCDGAGIDPGAVPAVAAGFRGYLTCVETSAEGTPIAGNHLTGTATLTNLTTGDISQYNAIGFAGRLDTNDGDARLCLTGNASNRCPMAGEYAACPQTWILNHDPQGAADPLGVPGATIDTAITAAAVTMNFADGIAPSIEVHFETRTDIGGLVTADKTMSCWADWQLTDISPQLSAASLGAVHAVTRVTTIAQEVSEANSGIVLIAERLHVSPEPNSTARAAAADVHHDGNSGETSVIVLPPTSPPP